MRSSIIPAVALGVVVTCLISPVFSAASTFEGEYTIPALVAKNHVATGLNETDVVNSTSIKLVFHNPNTNLSTTCNTTWSADSSPPTNNVFCTDNRVRFNIDEDLYHGIENMTLNFLFTYTDPSVGEPPYDQLTLLGPATAVQGKNYTCAAQYYGGSACWIPRGSKIRGQVQTAVAKA